MSAANPPRFMPDHMAIRPGKHRNIIGRDAAWDLGADLREPILRANRKERVFVTRNRRTANRPPPPERLLLPITTDPVAQRRTLTATFALDPIERLFPAAFAATWRSNR